MNRKYGCQDKQYWMNRGYAEKDAIFKARSYAKINPEYWIKRGYSADESRKLASESTYKSKSSSKYWISIGYSKKDARMEARKHKKDYPEYWMIRGMNEEDAVKESRKYRKNHIEYWISRGYDMVKAQYEVDKRSRKKIDYWKTKGYSEEESMKLANKISKTSSKGTKSYWLDKGYSEEESIVLARENMKISHNRYVEYWTSRGYSEEEAKIKVNEQKPSCIEYWLLRGYSKEDAEEIIKHIKCPINKANVNLTSKMETKFLNELEKYIGEKIDRSVWTRIFHNNFCSDGRIGNTIIEFNGEKFHLDDRFYNNESKTPYNKTYKEVKEYDNHKIQLYLQHGYNVIVVWQNDYKYSKEILFGVLKDVIQEYKNTKGQLWDSSKYFFLV